MLVSIKFLLGTIAAVVLTAECSMVKKTEVKNGKDNERSKRESVFSSNIYYDQVAQQAVQPLSVTPSLTQPVQQQQQQQQQQHQHQSLPILGALISSVPSLNGIASTLTTLVPLGTLANLGNLGGLGGLGNLGGLAGLSGLGNLGGLTNLGGLAGLGNLPGLSNLGGILAGTAVPKCPTSQTLNCRCEHLAPLPAQPTPTRSSDGLEILHQSIKRNLKGDKEISARLSNGLLLYQRSGIEKLANNKMSQVIQGFYTLQLKERKYLTIYYTINDLDYTVKADVTAEPPQNDLSESPATAQF